MKKTILFICTLGVSTAMFAQAQKGSIGVFGSFGFGGAKLKSETGSTINTDVTGNSFNFSPGVSYFFTDKIEAGILFGINSSKTTQNNPTTGISKVETKEPLTQFGVFGNYYFGGKDNFSWFGGVSFATGTGTGKVTTTPVSGNATVVETDNKATNIGLTLGFVYFVRNNLNINASIGLLNFNSAESESTTAGVTSKETYNDWTSGLNGGPSLNLGLKFFFNAGK